MDNEQNFENAMYYDPNAYIMPWRKTAKKEESPAKYNYAELPNYATGQNVNYQPSKVLYPDSYADMSKSYNVAQEMPKTAPQQNAQPNLMSGLSNLFGGGGLGNLLGGGGLSNILSMLNGGGLSNILSSLGGNGKEGGLSNILSSLGGGVEGGGLENITKLLGGLDFKNLLGGGGGNILNMFSKSKQQNVKHEDTKTNIDDYEKVEE